jgi:two-component system LytT family response regulator
MTVTALIVDDEPLARRRLRALVGDLDWMECIGEVADGPAALRALDDLRPDVAFLDIHLPGLSGLEVLARLRRSPAIIFTTAHDRYAATAFELAALDYLLKPFGVQRFQRAMERARPILERRAVVDAPPIAGDKDVARRLFVREGGRIVPLATRAIERLEACDDFVQVHSAGRCYRVNATLHDLEARLDAACFVRVHRSHIVNLDHVVGWEPYDGSRFLVRLRDGTRLTASRQRSRVLRHVGR